MKEHPEKKDISERFLKLSFVKEPHQDSFKKEVDDDPVIFYLLNNIVS